MYKESLVCWRFPELSRWFQDSGTSSDTLYRSAWIGVLGHCPLGKRNPAVTHARSVWKLLGRRDWYLTACLASHDTPFSTSPLFSHFLSVLLSLSLSVFLCLSSNIPTCKNISATDSFSPFYAVYISQEIIGKRRIWSYDADHIQSPPQRNVFGTSMLKYLLEVCLDFI